MLKLLEQRLSAYTESLERYNQLREILQLEVLSIIDEKSFFRNISFLGGTALRVLYKINRFSEDLDFSLVNNNDYSFDKLNDTLENELKKRNLNIEVKRGKNKNVRHSFIKFSGLLNELNIYKERDRKLSIKIEIDENPPLGYKTETSLITENFFININHYDKASLFAGKLHAVLDRKYTKGRDFYDLLWFLGQKIEPNINLLKNALEQSRGKKLALDHQLVKELLKNRIEEVDFKEILADLKAFLINSQEERFFNKEVFLKAI